MPKRLEPEIKYPPRKMVVLTPKQNEFVEIFRVRRNISGSEAIRQIVDLAIGSRLGKRLQAQEELETEQKLLKLLAE